MTIFNVHEAKSTLSELIARAEAGEDVVIARANRPVVRLVPVAMRRERRVLGLNASTGFAMADDFDAPLANESAWYDEAGVALHEPATPDRKPAKVRAG